MLKIIGRKLGMTQLFSEDGTATPVTIIKAGPCQVVQVKTVKSDSYNAIQIGFEDKRDFLVNKPMGGHFKKYGVKPKKTIRETRLSDKEIDNYKSGDIVDVGIFSEGEYVDVEGKTKGRGFAGVMKRHGFAGFPASHGTHEYFRHSGAIGCRTTPGRVMKGKKMGGHMGNSQRTVQNLKIVKIMPEDNFILVKGAIPGPKNSLVLVKKSVKKTAAA